jgi:hypothetical protein
MRDLMKHQIVVIGIALVVLSLLAGCGSTAAPATPVPTTAVPPTAVSATTPPETPVPDATAGQTGAEVIFLERTGGLQGLDESWSVYQNGKIESSHGSTVIVPPDQVQMALTRLTSIGFFNFEDEYGTSSPCNDCITYRMTVTSGGVTKTVTAVQGAEGTPANVLAAMEFANRLVSGVGE